MKYNRNKFWYLEEQYEKVTSLGREKEQEPNIFLAKKKTTQKIVVLKYVSMEVLPIYQKLKELEHPALVKILDSASDGSQGLIIEEYVSGRTLAEEMEVKGVFSEQDSIKIIEELLDVLCLIHTHGMIHRDITPNNVLISTDGVLKLIDFGIAREKKENCIQDTTILGTAGFAAPEQFGFQQTDERTDIYALGVLWNKMLTGKFPRESLYRNNAVASIIQKCTQIDVANRYQCVEDVEKELALLQGKILPTEKKDWKKFVPGFRTGVTWKYIVATIGYLCMIFSTIMFLGEFGLTAKSFFLELIAVVLYIWVATLLAANIFGWDRKLWPFRLLPKAAAIVMRIFVWLFVFWAGVSLEEYVKVTILGIKTVNGA